MSSTKTFSIRLVVGAVLMVFALSIVSSASAQSNNRPPGEGQNASEQTQENKKKRIAPKSYDECISLLANNKYDDVSRLRNMTADKVEKKKERLNKKKQKLQERKEEQLAVAYRDQIIAGIDADIAKLDEKVAQSNATENVPELRTNLCAVVFEISRFREKQAVYAIWLGRIKNMDSKFITAINKPYHKDFTGNVSADVNERLGVIRGLVTENDKKAQTALDALMKAKNLEEVEAAVDKEAIKAMIVEIRKAHRIRTEVLAIRVAAKDFNQDLDVSVVSVVLKDSSGKDLPADSAGRPAREAVVTLRVSGEQGEQVKKLTRASSTEVWRIAR